MAYRSSRTSREIRHGEKIVADAEHYWGWASEAGKVRITRRAALLINKADLPNAKRVLEIGCGTGVFSQHFAATGAQLWALDIYDGFLRIARQKCPGEKLKVVAGDAHNLPLKDGSFDAVVGSSILHHVDVGSTFEEIKRVLKPGGLIAFAEPNMLNPINFFRKNICIAKRISGESPDETAFVRWRISKELKACGFVRISAEPYDFLHPALPLRFIPFFLRLGRMIEKVSLAREIAGSLLISAQKA